MGEEAGRAADNHEQEPKRQERQRLWEALGQTVEGERVLRTIQDETDELIYFATGQANQTGELAIVKHGDFVDIPPTRSSTLYVINFSTTPHADPDLLLAKHVVVLYLASHDKNASTRAVKTTISGNNAVLYECLDLQIMANDELLVSAAGYEGIATLTANVTTQTRGWQSEKLITGYPEPGEWRWKRMPIPSQHGAGSITSADIRTLRADDLMSTDSTYTSYDQNGNLLYPGIKPEGNNTPVTQTLQGRRLSIAQNVYQIVEQSSIDGQPVT